MPESQFINVHFEPTLRKVQQDFVRLEKGLENKREVFAAALAVAQHDINEMFDEERDATGQSWAPWEEPYATRAENLPNIGILNRRGRPDGLRALATNSNAFAIAGDRLTYGAGLPSWAGVHLHGGQKVFSTGYRIPKRSFYPYSKEGVAAVERVFSMWAEGEVAILTRKSSRGRVFTQVQTRTPSGQFGPSPL